MTVAEETNRRQVSNKKITEEELGRVREMLANPNRLAKWLNRSGVPVPQWVSVERGCKISAFHFSFPVRIKPLSKKRPSQVCQNKDEVETAVSSFKDGCHIQRELTGYHFWKVRVVGGRTEEAQPPQIQGLVRRVVTLLVSIGLTEFELTVAASSDLRTVFIVP